MISLLEQEIRESKVRNLAAPECFHPVEVQILKADSIEALREIHRRLPVEVLSVIRYQPMNPSDGETRLVPRSAAPLFAG